MKNLLIVAVVLFCNLLFFSCTNTTTEEKSAINTTDVKVLPPPPVIKDTISLHTDSTWKSNWALHSKDWLDTTTLISFFLPLVDFHEVISEDATNSRFYMGLKAEGTGYTAKLMVVGVNAKGQDMIDYDNGEYIYDLSKACPPNCNLR